jgi:hypothetical protein
MTGKQADTALRSRDVARLHVAALLEPAQARELIAVANIIDRRDRMTDDERLAVSKRMVEALRLASAIINGAAS